MTRPANFKRVLLGIVAGGLTAAGFLPEATAQTAADTAAAPAPPPVDIHGAQLNIAPLRVELDDAKTAATVILTNTSPRALSVQIRLFAWSQEAGEDKFAPSTALTVSPSIATLPAGESQIVRLIRNAAPGTAEQRFRLAVDQLPDPTLSLAGAAEARIRFTLPVFLDRSKAAPAQLAWRQTGTRLELANTGGRTAKVANLIVRTADGRTLTLGKNTLRYVQGGAAIAWPASGACTPGPLAITAHVDGEPANVQGAATCG
jgi:fimbrial chaperone protein